MGENEFNNDNQYFPRMKFGMPIEPISASLGILASLLSIASSVQQLIAKRLKNEANACESKHVKARKTATTQIDKDQADIDAAQCMCAVLRDLYRYNGKTLPSHGPFKNWWDSYDCKL